MPIIIHSALRTIELLKWQTTKLQCKTYNNQNMLYISSANSYRCDWALILKRPCGVLFYHKRLSWLWFWLYEYSCSVWIV